MSITDDVTGGGTTQPSTSPPPPPPPPPVEPDPPPILVQPTSMNPVARTIISKRAKRLRDDMGTITGQQKPSNQSLREAYDTAAKRQKMPP